MNYRIKGSILKTSCKSGSKFHPEYDVTIDEKGHRTIAQTGKTNRYAKIQEDLESTKIENILQRAKMGDPNALNRIEGQYLDLTEMPDNFRDAQNKILKMKSDFEKLPVDIRRQFDFSPEKYVSEIGQESWLKAMGYVKEPEEKKPEVKEPEVKNTEVKETIENE